MAVDVDADSEIEEETLSLFHEDGLVVLKQKIPMSLIEQLHSYAQIVFVSIFSELHRKGHSPYPEHCKKSDEGIFYGMGLGVKRGFREIVMRSPGRYEISLLERKDMDPNLVQSLKNAVSDFAPALIGGRSWDSVQICNLSLVVSTPGSVEQAWHADGGHVDLDQHLPCHVYNIFIPLSNVTLDMGPTQLRPGTHVLTRKLAPMMLAAKARGKLRAPVTPLLSKGDALAFDYRILHRGLANKSNSNRIILVLTLGCPWFQDILNFPCRSISAVCAGAENNH